MEKWLGDGLRAPPVIVQRHPRCRAKRPDDTGLMAPLVAGNVVRKVSASALVLVAADASPSPWYLAVSKRLTIG